MLRCRMIYCCDGYTLADVFRPQPSWGKRSFSADIGANTPDDELIKVAGKLAPQGYWLQLIEVIGGDPHVRVAFAKPIPFSAQKGTP